MSERKKIVQLEWMDTADLLGLISMAVREAVGERIQELQTMDPQHKYITTEDVCTILNVSRQTVYDWEKKNILVPFRFGNRKRFKLSDVHAMIEKGYRGNPPQEVTSKVTTQGQKA